ncbi:MAG: uridine kinase [Oscillospiraceae bacterium]
MTETLQSIIHAVDTRRQTGKRVILAIDGMAAAGKTTAAGLLSGRWDAPVVHMDDFFLPPALRTEKRLAEPGGNVHYERFQREVLAPLAAGEAFSYRRFRCGLMDYDGVVPVSASPVVIVEGAYALHPRFGAYADVTAFFAVSPALQKQRILHRGGAEAWEAFENRWIPMENTYHAAFGIRERAQLVVKDFGV